MSLNKCMIIGNLGRDPEMRYTAFAGVSVAAQRCDVVRRDRIAILKAFQRAANLVDRLSFALEMTIRNYGVGSEKSRR